MALIGGVIRSASTHTPIIFANAQLTGNFPTTVSTDGNGIWNAAWGYEGVSVNHFAGNFSPVTRNYTERDIQYYPAYGQYGYWAVVELVPLPVDPNASCFTGETEVMMEDGTLLPIALVAVGDRILGGSGTPSTVIGVERPRLGERKLYSFDGGRPFVTAEHPFLTADGWCAVDVMKLRAEHSILRAGTLREGARMRRLVAAGMLVGAGAARGTGAAALATFLETQVLTSIREHAGDPSQTVYNLLLDGSHTYTADGWVVHNKTSSH